MEVSDVVDMDVPATKKRKICDGDVKLSPALLRLRSHSGVADTPGSLLSPATSVNSKENYASNEPAGSSTSCCSRNGSVDLDENGMEVIASAENRVVQTRSSSERQVESGELESTKMPQHENSHRRTPGKKPSENEIEEFFEKCEKDMLKRFREKYNFDFEKEEPLEGRYEWVQKIGT